MAKFIINKFWSPVGEGAKPKTASNAVITTLFSGVEGLETIQQRVTRRIQQLPGLEGLRVVTDRIAATTNASLLNSNAKS